MGTTGLGEQSPDRFLTKEQLRSQICCSAALAAAAGAFTSVHILGDTFAKRLRVVPVRIPGADALDDRGALLQGVARVAGELDHSSHAIERVGGAEVAVLEVRLVAVAALEGWRRNRNVGQSS